jgi:hypothetical protein
VSTTPGVPAVACLPAIFIIMLLLTFLVLLGPAVLDIPLLLVFSPLLMSFLFYQFAACVNNPGVPVVACLPAVFSTMLLLVFLVLFGPAVIDIFCYWCFHHC